MLMALANARIVQSMPEPEYRAHKNWSVSQFKMLPKKPELFHGFYVASPPLFEFEETPGMLFGTCAHGEFLEGRACSMVPAEYLTSNGQRRGKAYEAYRAMHGALECLNAKEMAAVQGIRASCDAQSRVMDLLWGKGPTEVSIFANDEETGLDVMGRLDKWRKVGCGIIGDLKVTDIDPDDERAIINHVFQMQYVQPAAFYTDLLHAATGERPEFIFVFARKKPPYTVRLWQPSENDIDLGRRRNRLALLDLRRRLDSGDWTGDRHNRVNAGADGSLLPRYAYTDAPGDNPPNTYDEFSEFAISEA